MSLVSTRGWSAAPGDGNGGPADGAGAAADPVRSAAHRAGPAADQAGPGTERIGAPADRAPAREAFRQAVLGGLAPDGGLFLPASLPHLDREELEGMRGASFQEVARAVGLRLLSPYLEPEEIGSVVADALDFPVPVVPLDDRTRVLELFHGPTGSFKDVGARFLARLLSRLRRPEDGRIVVLVATSGDTGGAVARAVRGIPGVHAVVVYPVGRMSPLQLCHVTTPPRSAPEGSEARGTEAEGAEAGEPKGEGSGSERTKASGEWNVLPVGVRGSFDDCQRMVKEILAETAPVPDTVITSANSVNLGRLLPQTFYYVYAWTRLPDPSPLVSVPSGNLGNLTAGTLARRMGVPFGGFVAAMNENGALPRYLATASLPEGESRPTLSSAMDVVRPSNLERLLALAAHERKALAREVAATRHGDEATRAAMRELLGRYGYLADPHTAVGWAGLEEVRAEAPEASEGPVPGLVVATADPAKFPETVREATDRTPPARSDWQEELERARTRDGGGPEPVEIRPETPALRDLLHRL